MDFFSFVLRFDAHYTAAHCFLEFEVIVELIAARLDDVLQILAVFFVDRAQSDTCS